jgi:hypothetical protein
MEIPNPKSQAPNSKSILLALGFGTWVLGFGICVPPPALAQSPYVAGAIGAVVSRSSHSDSSFYSSPSIGAEVPSGALRVGTSITGIWGVELEYVRAGRSSEETPIFNPLARTGSISVDLAQLLPGVAPGIPIPFPFDYRSEVTRRHMSMNAVAWARQPVGGAVDLVYLAGIAFTRERSDVTQNIIPVPRAIVPPAPTRSTFTEYATRPLVGMEARIGLTPRLRLIPGLRVQGLGDGWLVRPNVAVGWFF